MSGPETYELSFPTIMKGMSMAKTSLYIGIDVETARPNSGICEFAAVALDADGKPVFNLSRLVDPGISPWDAGCRRIHGISPDDVAGRPRFQAVWNEFLESIGRMESHDVRCFAHNASFERRVLAADLGLEVLPFEIECTLQVSRQFLEDLESHSLDRVASVLGVPLANHHRAEPDATAVAHLARLLDLHGPGAPRASVEAPAPSTTRPPTGWIANASRGRNREVIEATERTGNILAQETIVFTGAFACGLERRDAKRLAAAQGAVPRDTVSDQTTILVVAGVGHPIPPDELKTRKARSAIERGIRLMSEPEFLAIVNGG